MNEQDVVREFRVKYNGRVGKGKGDKVKVLNVPLMDWMGDEEGAKAERWELSREVRSCAACTGMKGSRDYGPEWAGGVGRRGHVALLGDMNGPLSRWERYMRRAGWTEDEVSWLPAQSCREHVARMIEASASQFVVLAGARAVSEWRGDLGREVQGYVGIGGWGEDGFKYVMPIWDTTTSEAALALENFSLLCHHEGMSGSYSLGVRCVKCGDWMSEYDRDGIPWCALHARRYKILPPD